MKKSIIFVVMFSACMILAGCDTFQFTQKSMCKECLAEARTRSDTIAATLLSSKNPTVKVSNEILVIGAGDQLLNVFCSGDSGCIVSTTRKKSDGTMSAPHTASAKELEYLYCPKTLKKYSAETE